MGMSVTSFKSSVGRYVPVCKGKYLVLSSDDGGAVNLVWVSFFMMAIPCAVWFLSVAGSLPAGAGVVCSLVVGVLFLYASSQLFLCYTTEPGILPFKEIEYQLDGSETKFTKYVLVVDNEEVPLEEKRAKICRQTNTAIENFDHYCPWTGNAVGKRNYPFFFKFVTSATALSVVVFALTTWAIAYQSMRAGESLEKYLSDSTGASALVQIGVAVYCMILFMTLIGLNGYHCFLVSHATTTNEQLKGVYFGKQNPNDHGCMSNYKRILFSPIPNSEVQEGEAYATMSNPLVSSALSDDKLNIT